MSALPRKRNQTDIKRFLPNKSRGTNMRMAGPAAMLAPPLQLKPQARRSTAWRFFLMAKVTLKAARTGAE